MAAETQEFLRCSAVPYKMTLNYGNDLFNRRTSSNCEKSGILNFLIIEKLELLVHVLGTVAQFFLKFWPYITDFVGVRYIILSVKLLHKPIDELLTQICLR